MRLHTCIPLLPLLAFTYITSGQVDPKLAFTSEPAAQQTGPTSTTYADAIQMLKAWIDTEDHAALARLFTEGEARNSDLLAACRSEVDRVAVAAFAIRHLLGRPPCGECSDSVRRELGRYAPPCADNLTDADLERIDQWWAKRRTPDGYKCHDDEGLVYGEQLINELVLRGSPNSKSALIRMLAFERSCEQTETITSKALDRAQSLVAATFELGQNLRLETDINTSIRASAFFIPSKHRKNTEVEVIARTDDRILLEASYVCGGLCGRGYYVVLRKNGPVWQYAVIMLAWVA
jgi:hypothetical protein